MTTIGGTSTSSASAITRRSARRQTVRATCSADAFGVPPGRMNASSGSSSASPSSIARSSSRDARVVDACLLELLLDLLGVRCRKQGAEREEVALDGDEHLVDARHHLHRACHPENRVELIDVAVGLDARMILRNAPATEEPGITLVARLGVDLHGSDVKVAMWFPPRAMTALPQRHRGHRERRTAVAAVRRSLCPLCLCGNAVGLVVRCARVRRASRTTRASAVASGLA